MTGPRTPEEEAEQRRLRSNAATKRSRSRMDYEVTGEPVPEHLRRQNLTQVPTQKEAAEKKVRILARQKEWKREQRERKLKSTGQPPVPPRAYTTKSVSQLQAESDARIRALQEHLGQTGSAAAPQPTSGYQPVSQPSNYQGHTHQEPSFSQQGGPPPQQPTSGYSDPSAQYLRASTPAPNTPTQDTLSRRQQVQAERTEYRNELGEFDEALEQWQRESQQGDDGHGMGF